MRSMCTVACVKRHRFGHVVETGICAAVLHPASEHCFIEVSSRFWLRHELPRSITARSLHQYIRVVVWTPAAERHCTRRNSVWHWHLEISREEKEQCCTARRAALYEYSLSHGAIATECQSRQSAAQLGAAATKNGSSAFRSHHSPRRRRQIQPVISIRRVNNKWSQPTPGGAPGPCNSSAGEACGIWDLHPPVATTAGGRCCPIVLPFQLMERRLLGLERAVVNYHPVRSRSEAERCNAHVSSYLAVSQPGCPSFSSDAQDVRFVRPSTAQVLRCRGRVVWMCIPRWCFPQWTLGRRRGGSFAARFFVSL